MAGSLFVLLDDISTTLDDVATMTKIAAKKTSGVLGDDLALNAEQVSGVNADRELPVVWGVAKGSLVNKAILVPAAIGLSAFIPGAIVPLLGLGGLYLCYEGSEKVLEKLFHKPEHKSHDNVFERKPLSAEEEKKQEKEKIKGAVKTDFILSAEIITIALGTFSHQPIMTQAVALTTVGVAMTAGVYGSVAGIVKMDDAGLWLHQLNKDNLVEKMNALDKKVQHQNIFVKSLVYAPTKLFTSVCKTALNNEGGIHFLNKFGKATVSAMPKFMKSLNYIGTAAMFTVGGGILAHTLNHFGINQIHHITEGINSVAAMGVEAAVGLAIGTVAVGCMQVKDKVVSLFKKPEEKAIEVNHKPSYHVHNEHKKTTHNVKPTKKVEHTPGLSAKVEQEIINITEKPSMIIEEVPSAFERISLNTNMQKNNSENKLKF